MAQSLKNKRDQSPPGNRPNMSDLRIVLLGKNVSENNRVGNLILDKQVFGKKSSQPDETLSEMVKGRNITVISLTHLLDPELSLQKMAKNVLVVSPPEPYVIILVLQHNDFSKKYRNRLTSVLNCFGDQAKKHTMILTTDDELRAKQKSVKENKRIQKISTECGGGRLQIQNAQCSHILKKVDEIITDSEFETQQSSSLDQGDMRDLRIVLLGKTASENSKVGNLIFGTDVFCSETSPVERKLHQHSQRVRGMLNDRRVAIINSAQLLQTHLSLHQITQTVRECVSLSDPGPHVFILVLQYNDFTEEDRYRVEIILKEFSEEAIKRTIVITTDEETYGSKITAMIKNNSIHQLIKECGGRHRQLYERKPEWQSEMFKMIDEKLKENLDEYLTCQIYYDVKGRSEDKEQSSSVEENEESSYDRDYGIPEKRNDKVSSNLSEKQNLNLVLCGSDTTLKDSVSKLFRGKKIKPSQLKMISGECVKKEKINGRQISLVELPALSQLSEEEVMRQTLRCVSLCDPGVHVFLLIVPVGALTDEDNAEIEKIQKIFYSREHFFLLFTTELTADGFASEFVKSSPVSQRFISRCGGQYRVMGLNEPENSKQISELLDYIENMKIKPYSPQMYIKAQENRVRQELEEQHKKELSEMESKIKELQQKMKSDGAKGEADAQECLRIVLIGRTGNGKSATGNTILGREEFQSQISTDSVTTVCEKGVGEVDDRSVAVVDTPGLFDTTLTNDHVVEEIMKCVSMSSPGPHVFVIVLSLGRITKEEMDTMDLIKHIFGPKSAQFSIVLFTRGDELGNESIEDYVKRSKSAELKKLIRDCGNRFLVFNNKEKRDKTQVIQLLKMIEELKNTNEGRYFTNSMFEEAEMSIKKRMEEILKEREREIQKQREELQTKHEMKMRDMMKRLKEEKQRADEERKQIENEFRQKEEKLLKDFEEKHKMEQKKQQIENQKQSEKEKQQRAEYHQKIEELKREIEKQRSQYEKQQKEREEEDRREEKYRQDQEKMRNEQERIIAELQMEQEEETKKRDLEKKMRHEEEEEERRRWESKIKEAENDRKEIQEEIKRQQREWENEKKQQMREREEEERKRKEKHEEELREKQEELEKMRKRFGTEREEKQQKTENERQKQRREREAKEREYEEKKTEMKKHYEQLERERKEEWERRKREDDERREEERKRWKEMIDDLKRVQEEQIKKREEEEKERKEREEKMQEKIKKEYEQVIELMKKKHEDEARKQAEESNDFRERKEQHVQELKEKLEEHQKQQELLEKLYNHLQLQKEEEIKELQEEVEKLCQSLQDQKEKEINKLRKQAETLIEHLKDQKGDKIEALQQEVEQLCQSLQDQKGDKIKEIQKEAKKLHQCLQVKKEEHLKKLQKEADDRKKKWCLIM